MVVRSTIKPSEKSQEQPSKDWPAGASTLERTGDDADKG